ncbi:MAG: exodeoxyribonuclease VII small subunit [Candidatus Dormibacteria bacterium]
MPDEAPETAIEELSYEDALAELETLIRRLETGSIDLADAVKVYERGVALAAHCGGLLEDTEKKVQRLVLGPRGEPSEVPMDAGDAP